MFDACELSFKIRPPTNPRS